MFDQFFTTANLPRRFSSYFITLIPKVDSPFRIGDFRPISLVGSLYKLVAKGRQLEDGVVAVNEIIDLAKKSRKECLIFKVDFEKAWVRACIFSGNLSILVNGMVEGLSAAVRTVEERNLYTGFKVGNSMKFVSHLQYADDTLFLREAIVANLWSIKAILRGFELASAPKVNFGKSKVMGVNVSGEFLGLAERFLHCSRASLPFTYLGLPAGANARSLSTWQPLIDKISRKLGSWKNKWVSMGGRVVLLNSVLNSIPIVTPRFY
ncbi:LINE-1 reverse transcriptase like [Trifolium medium]|uniref:LINE-1 reverse transcriptase like n=1 Tax=Trifolium medium TaxID=97028 RepID=A0A392M3Y7_9FABA|nr:LINE-1 reverse transcriptase like [Trifolium medium]